MPKAARSHTVETAIKSGSVAKRGTDPEVQIKPLAAGDVVTPGMLAGVVLLSPTRPYEQVDGGSGIEAGNTAACLRFGSVFMDFAEAVTAGEIVGQDLATGLLYGYPSDTSDDTLAAGRVLVPGLRIVQTTSASGPATVEVNLFGGDVDGPHFSGAVRLSNIPIGPVARASIGTDAAHVNGTIYYSEIVVPTRRTVTGIGVLNGTTVGTNNLIAALYDAAGALVANTALAGTLGAGADTFQEIALTAPVTIEPGRYFVATQANGTTHQTQKIATATYLNATGSVAGAFGTLPAITPPTTTTADVGPVAYLY